MDTQPMLEATQAISYSWMLLRMLGVLGLLLLIMFLVVKFLLPILTRKGIISSKKNGIISVVQRFTLEPRKNLYIVKVAKKRMLIGTSDKSMTFMGELSADDLE